ncbi:MAG: peptide chain release factor family protein [Nitrospiria bacterium]
MIDRKNRPKKTGAKGPQAQDASKAPRMNEVQGYSVDRDVLVREVVIHTFRASGPGGQHRNVTNSGVRIVHPPSGVVVSATESRSQFRNKEKALERLIARLSERNRARKRRVRTMKPRAVRERELDEKHRRQEKKRMRKQPDLSD